MILVDFNQTIISTFLSQVGSHTDIDFDISMFRHMALNTIRSYRTKFKKEFGELVICCDSKQSYWRKDFFPYYKANRKEARQRIDVDWGNVYKCIDTIKKELKDNFQYPVIEVDGGEADDVIATLIFAFSPNNKMIIMSADHDFKQLHYNQNIFQYSIITKEFVKCDDWASYLKEHIIRGDRGDGIPGCISDADTFVIPEKRQKRMTQKIFDNLMNEIPPEYLERFEQNKKLIDLRQMPREIAIEIINMYDEQKDKIQDKQRIRQYFMDSKLRHLIENINEF